MPSAYGNVRRRDLNRIQCGHLSRATNAQEKLGHGRRRAVVSIDFKVARGDAHHISSGDRRGVVDMIDRIRSCNPLGGDDLKLSAVGANHNRASRGSHSVALSIHQNPSR